MGAWIAENWFNLLSAGGIIASLLFTAVSLRDQTKAQRIGNLLALTESHRDIWSNMLSCPDLARVLWVSANPEAQPATENEQIYVTMVILHLSATYEAMKSGLSIKPSALREDVRLFFSLPIPLSVWNRSKLFQDDDFREFVEDCLKPSDSRSPAGNSDLFGAALHNTALRLARKSFQPRKQPVCP
jgi:hypothetical protein